MTLYNINLPWFLVIPILLIYILVILYTFYKILLDTNSTPKTLAYLLLVIVLPIIGVLFYFAFGVNYRHRHVTRQGISSYKEITLDFKKNIPDNTGNFLKTQANTLNQYAELVRFIFNIGRENLTKNDCQLLVNGEEKFPDVLATLESAKHFIHLEYYLWEDDINGNLLKELLLKKASEGIKVRVMYDDYASRKIKKTIVKELHEGGVAIYPVIKVKLVRFASRVNHRDHRKIIIVDGRIGFIGGINISDRYDNSIDTELFWRDTHVKITGELVLNLQRHFIVNWNSCQPIKLHFDKTLFPEFPKSGQPKKTELAQVIAGGPIYPMSTIMLTFFKIFNLATKRIYITNPYFIPNESILDALKQAAVSGVDVRIMVPKNSDSAIVGAASRFYFKELLQAGAKIFLYKKGFVHAKTVVADSYLSVVGTANMDIRSFDLNFEIMSVIYGQNFAQQLEAVFLDDLKQCDEISYEDWLKQGKIKLLTYAIARLISSFL